MGFMDKARPTGMAVDVPDCGNHYFTEVDKGSLNVQRWNSRLNDMHRQGYRLAHVFEQNGNTVAVFEHYPH